eukprot:1157866-Pelagomonas_calceolata.AAC.5
MEGEATKNEPASTDCDLKAPAGLQKFCGAYEMEAFGEDDLVQVMAAALQTRSTGTTQVREMLTCLHEP